MKNVLSVFRLLITWRLVCLMAVAFFFFISQLQPTSINTLAGHDDAWFVSRAESIVSGDWLGPYNELTLIKGPAYPLFLAINHWLGTPLWLLQAALYFVACLAFTASLKSMVSSHAVRSALFIALLLQPALLPIRVIRDNIYPALLLLSLAGLLLTASNPDRKSSQFLKIFLYGIALAFFWHTREESVWLVPCALMVLTWSLFQSFGVEKSMKPWTARVSLLLIASLIPTAAFIAMNHRYYQTQDIVEFKGSAFQGALHALSSVSEEHRQSYLPVSAAKRQMIYLYSPSFKELSPTLESSNNGWKSAGCGLYPHTCGDFAGGWFAWALRSAAQGHDKYTDSSTAGAFFEQITHDISNACERGDLVCKEAILPFLPSIGPDELAKIPDALARGIRLTLYQMEAPSGYSHSFGPTTRIAEIQDFTHETNVSPPYGRHLQFITNQETAAFAKMSCTEALASPYELKFDSEIVFLATNDPNRIVFSSFIPQEASCQLIVGDQAIAMNGKEIYRGNIVGTGSQKIYVKHVSTRPNHTPEGVLGIKIRLVLFNVYKYLTPFIALIGFLGYLVCISLLLGQSAKLWLLILPATAFWVLYLSRMAILTLIDITSFPGMIHLYLMPAFPALLIASVLSLQATTEIRQAPGLQ